MIPLSTLLATFSDFLEYVTNNLIFLIIVAACLLAIIVICIILIKTGKAAKRKEESVAETVQTAAEKTDASSTELNAVKEEKKQPQFQTEVPAEVPAEDPSPKPTKSAGYKGKWLISQTVIVDESGNELDGAYFFQLKASNGEDLITSEEYTSYHGAVQGIETFKANIEKENFKISVSKKGKYIVKLFTAQDTLLTQGEKYGSRSQALNAVASIKRFASTAVKAEGIQVNTILEEPVSTTPERSYDATKKGKWLIKKTSVEGEKDSYHFELRASNGQVLLTSEGYSSLAGAKNGVKTHKNNIEKGNVKAVITRNGDYILKIYTANGQLLSLGEHYKNKQLCQNAVESVKRFAKSAETVVE